MGSNHFNLLLIIIGIMIGKAYLMEDDLLKKNISMKNPEVTDKSDHSIADENDEHLTLSTGILASTSSGLTNASVIDNHAKIALENATKINSLDIITSTRHLHRRKSSHKDSQFEKLKNATSSTRKIKDVPLTWHQRFNKNSVDHSTSIHGNVDSSKLNAATSSSIVTTSLYVLTSSSIAIPSLNSSEDISPGSFSSMTYRESNSTTKSNETNNSTSRKTDATDDKSSSQSVELMSYSFTNVEESNDTKILDKLQQRIDNIISTRANSSNFFNNIAVGSQDQPLIQENVEDIASSTTNVSSISYNGKTTKQIPEIQKSYHTEQSLLTSQALSFEEQEEVSNDLLKMPLKVIIPLILNPIDTENNTDSAGGSKTTVQSNKKVQDLKEEISQEHTGIIHDYGPQCSTSFNKEKKQVFDNKLQQNIAFRERLVDDVSISASAGKTKSEACSTNNTAPSRFERSMDTVINITINTQLSALNKSMNTEQENTGSCSIGSQCDSPSMNESTTQILQNDNLNVQNRSMGNELDLIELTSVNSTPIHNDRNNWVTIEQLSSERIAEETNNDKTKSIFLPHINFSDETESTSSASTLNFHFNKSLDVKENSTIDENIYIIEGLGYFKDTLDDMKEFEEDLEKRRDPFRNYGDSVDDIILTPQDNLLKMSDSVQDDTGPAIEHHVSTAQFHWGGNFVDPIVGSWWSNDDSRAVRTLDNNIGKGNLNQNSKRKTEKKDKLEIDQLRESLHVKDIDYSLSKKRSSGFYRNILLPAFYVTIGVTLFALSIWCKRALMTKKTNISRLREFFLKRRRPTHGTV